MTGKVLANFVVVIIISGSFSPLGGLSLHGESVLFVVYKYLNVYKYLKEGGRTLDEARLFSAVFSNRTRT